MRIEWDRREGGLTSRTRPAGGSRSSPDQVRMSRGRVPEGLVNAAAPDPADPNLGSPGRHGSVNSVVIHGDLDETVPLADSIAWATPREVPVVVVPGGEHFFHRKLHVLREVAARFVR